MNHALSSPALVAALAVATSSLAAEGPAAPRNNFLEVAPLGGVTLTAAGDVAGGGLGLTLGYARRVSDVLAIGPGVSFFYGLPNSRPTSGGALLLKVLLGDTSVRRVAFLAEAGGSYLGGGRWYLQAGAGAFLAGFTVKGGYLVSATGAAHSLLLSVGYTFSF